MNVLEYFGLNEQPFRIGPEFELFETFFLDQYKKNTIPVLLLDEAQNAKP
jgi:hypothetical protein